MGISKFNKGSRVDWAVKTEGWEIKKLRELELKKTYPLNGFFTTPDKGFGVGCILISDGFMVGIPSRYEQLIKDMLVDDETVADVKAGKCGFFYETFKSEKFNRDGFSVEFVEL